MTFVFVGLGFMGFLAATMLAIDVGMLMTARSQAQNSADAGALAGAVALVFDDYDDRTPSGPAVQSALNAATGNQVMAKAVSVTAPDVEFPPSPTGGDNWVRVTVRRTAERGNPVALQMAPIFKIATADISAVATAEASPANAATCVKPWAISDKWREIQTPEWDETDTFDVYGKNGKTKLSNPDIYVDADDAANYTGFRASPSGPDYGRQMLLKAGNPQQAINPSHFYPIALPGGTGASWYEQNIPGCWPGIMEMGDTGPVEPGNMTGPTTSGTRALIDKDPTAKWDPSTRRVISSYNPSPRVVVLPVFDPAEYEESRQRGRQEITVANMVGFFIEDLRGNDVLGRMVPMTGLISGGTPVPGGAYLMTIRLVQ
ncbi:MAG: Tad domain-containing protein [Acidobacteria bacterium]|nr:Tad domain-containing protein [Acidobacteriota bacterium]